MKSFFVIAGFFILTSISTKGQQHKAGFKTFSSYDSSRTYKPGVSTSDKLHYRPIDVDVWYPAEVVSSDTTATFGDLVKLLEQRSNFYDDTKSHSGLTDELLQYICANSNCSDHRILGGAKTSSHRNAKPAPGKFPLVIYLTGFNGMSYENYLLFESLAKNGFVVAAISSIGRYPGNMTMEKEDLFEQVRDADFAIDYLTKVDSISSIGLVGYSWGGLSAAIMAMEHRNEIKAFVSLDGSEQFTYAGVDEIDKLSRIRNATFFNPKAIQCPYLYLDSDVNVEDQPDSVYNIVDYTNGDKHYVKINQAAHEDFSVISVVGKHDQTNTRYGLIQQLTTAFLLDKLYQTELFEKSIARDRVTTKFKANVVQAGKPMNIVKGVIRSRKTNLPLPYVNIGVLNKDKGTTTNSKGEFELLLSESNAHDTLKISMVGYESKIIYLREVYGNTKSTINIQLNESVNELKEFVVSDRKMRTKVFGNKTDSKFFGGKFAEGDLGSEIAVRVKIKDTTYLDTFHFNISYNTKDTTTFRVNIYNVKNGQPDKNILLDNVIVRVKGDTGRIDVDLSKYNIVVYDDCIVGLQWIEGKTNMGVVFSAGFGNNGTYYRKASAARWKKFPMGVGFSITATH